jgi:uncharacterized membrane protein YjfL (UPF0719 family)
MQKLGSSIMKSRFWWTSTNITAFAGVIVAWILGFNQIKHSDSIFAVYFWGGLIFIVLLAINQVISANKRTK